MTSSQPAISVLGVFITVETSMVHLLMKNSGLGLRESHCLMQQGASCTCFGLPTATFNQPDVQHRVFDPAGDTYIAPNRGVRCLAVGARDR